MEWVKDKRYTNLYYTTAVFNGYKYNTVVTIEETDKCLKYWVSVSSGKKRKEFNIFEEKNTKSLGGIKALLWIKEAMYDFPEYYKNRVYQRKEYICIGWSDKRRRDIYERLLKYGFTFEMEYNRKVLRKKL